MTEPAQFFCYLRRRTQPYYARRFVAVDELDVLMWFVDGGFYFDVDPRQLYQQNPGMRRPKKRDKRAFDRDDPWITHLSTMTDPLDAWFQAGASTVADVNRDESSAVEKPVRQQSSWVSTVLGLLSAANDRARLTIGSDLVGLSWNAQVESALRAKSVAEHGSVTNELHKVTEGIVTPWGYLLVVQAYAPTPEARADTIEYVQLKKYQLRAARALCVLLSADGTPVECVCFSNVVVEDPDLNELVAASALQPIERSRSKLPPSARRATRRLRGVKANRKRTK